MAFSKHGRVQILSTFFLKTKAPALFLAAYRKTTAGVKEVFGGGYERIPCTKLALEGDDVVNSEDILFPVARRDWGEIVAIAIVDEQGEEIAVQDLAPAPEIPIGKRLRIPAGKLVVKLST